MLSKEEILAKRIIKFYSITGEFDKSIRREVLEAMDEYAKQESAIWKEKAEALFKALDAIMQYDQIDVPQISVELRHNAKKALEQFQIKEYATH